nr:MAG TPA: hypothetical protein [Caudoviricetes sp.]
MQVVFSTGNNQNKDAFMNFIQNCIDYNSC